MQRMTASVAERSDDDSLRIDLHQTDTGNTGISTGNSRKNTYGTQVGNDSMMMMTTDTVNTGNPHNNYHNQQNELSVTAATASMSTTGSTVSLDHLHSHHHSREEDGEGDEYHEHDTGDTETPVTAAAPPPPPPPSITEAPPSFVAVPTNTTTTTVTPPPPDIMENNNDIKNSSNDARHPATLHPKKKNSHQRRSNSDIPVSVQTGAFLQPPPPLLMSVDPFHGQHRPQYQHQHHQQQQPLWTSSNTRPSVSTATTSSIAGNHTQANMVNGGAVYHNSNHYPPVYHHKPPSPRASRALYHHHHPAPPPPPPQYYQYQQQQHQHQSLLSHNNYPLHPSQQSMSYNPQLSGAPLIFHPYSSAGSYSTGPPPPPPMIQKAASYAGMDRTTTNTATTTSMKSKPPPVPSDERQPLLLSSSLPFDRHATTNPQFGPRGPPPPAPPHHPNGDQRSQTQYNDNTQNGGHSGRHHRRSLSSPAAESVNYGAFWENIVGDSNNNDHPLHMSQRPLSTTRLIHTTANQNGTNQHRHPPPQQFSPRADFRKLQKGLSPKASSTTTNGRKQAPSMVVTNSRASSSRDIRLDSPTQSSSQNGNVRLHASWNEYNYHPSPQQQQHQHHRTVSYGGDGVAPPPLGSRSLLLQRGESLRKMHARQQSAQLLVQDIKGVEQPLTCRNVLFLLLFVFHLVMMIYLGQLYGPNAFVYHGTDTDAVTIVYSNLIYIAIWSGLFAVAISALLLGAMTYFAGHFVQIALFFMITLSFIWGTIGIGLSPKTTVPVTGIIALALAVAYTFIVWDRIPFASANLVTALTALRDFRGIVYVAFGFQFVALLYSVAYSILVFGIYDAMQDHGPLNLSPQMTYIVYVLLIFSFSWTLQVIQSTVHAITAAVIYKWWHEGRTEQNATLVKESCLKTIFYSTGSICFGSLVVGPVRFLRWFFVLFRPSSTESSSLMCFHECVHYIQSCVSFCVDSLAAKCNSWAYTYIGMYNYGFLEAGGSATELFEKRGWSTIVSDDLVPNVLFLTSLVIGGITGCFAYLLSELDRLAVVIPKDDPGLAPFVEGVIIGLVLPSVVFSLISSSVNAVLVCFASSPMDFEVQHPNLSHDMRAAWRNVWPRALLVDDAVAIRLVGQNSPFIHPSYQGREPSPF